MDDLLATCLHQVHPGCAGSSQRVSLPKVVLLAVDLYDLRADGCFEEGRSMLRELVLLQGAGKEASICALAEIESMHGLIKPVHCAPAVTDTWEAKLLVVRKSI